MSRSDHVDFVIQNISSHNTLFKSYSVKQT